MRVFIKAKLHVDIHGLRIFDFVEICDIDKKLSYRQNLSLIMDKTLLRYTSTLDVDVMEKIMNVFHDLDMRLIRDGRIKLYIQIFQPL